MQHGGLEISTVTSHLQKLPKMTHKIHRHASLCLEDRCSVTSNVNQTQNPTKRNIIPTVNVY